MYQLGLFVYIILLKQRGTPAIRKSNFKSRLLLEKFERIAEFNSIR